MTLYEINEAMLALVDPETGELMDYEAFTALNMARDEKLENICKWIKDLNAEAAAIKTEETALYERRKSKENKAESLKSYLTRMLDGETFECSSARVGYRKSEALTIENTTDLAEWLDGNGYPDLVTYGEPKIDKTSLKKLVKGGLDVPGVSVESRINLQVR